MVVLTSKMCKLFLNSHWFVTVGFEFNEKKKKKKEYGFKYYHPEFFSKTFAKCLLYRTWDDQKDQHLSKYHPKKMTGTEVTMTLARMLYGCKRWDVFGCPQKKLIFRKLNLINKNTGKEYILCSKIKDGIYLTQRQQLN